MAGSLIDDLLPERGEPARLVSAPEIRPLSEALVEALAGIQDDTAWARYAELWPVHLAEHWEGLRWSVVALSGSGSHARPVGYASLRWQGVPSSGAGEGIPEVTDLLVRPPERRRGIGRALLAELESWAVAGGHGKLSMRVGLTGAHGAVQRLAVESGFKPDGQGAMIGGVLLRDGMRITVDDRLMLRLVKDLQGRV